MGNRKSLISDKISSIFIEKDIICAEEDCHNPFHDNCRTFYCKMCDNCYSTKIYTNRMTESIPSLRQITCNSCRHVFYFNEEENVKKCKFIGPLRKQL